MKRRRILVIAVGLGVMFAARSAFARPRPFCSNTAATLFDACKAEVLSESLVQKAVCLNTSDAAARDACIADRKDARAESKQLCKDQRATRLDACNSLGEDRYDPNIDPALFDDPKNPTNPNPYFPLTVGDKWDYAGGDETDTVEIVNETKLIDGVTCIVARDVVTKAGDVHEATDDWYVPAKNGSTWYF